MGWLFNSTKKVAGKFFNFRVDQWIDYEGLKTNTNYIIAQAKNLFFEKKNNSEAEPEEFETAKQRLQLSDEDLKRQSAQYKRLGLFFCCLAGCIFLYFLFLVFKQHNYMGACMSFSLTLYSLSLAMRYHFWHFQIRQRKLGCSFKEWFFAFFNIKRPSLKS